MLANPVPLWRKVAPTKYFLAPINTGFVIDGQPTDALVRFHSARSGNSIGASYVGNVAISKDHVTNDSTPYFSSDLSKWELLASTIHNRGSKAAVQLGCRVAQRPASRKWSVPNKEEIVRSLTSNVAMLEETQLGNIVEAFEKAARCAAEAGFDIVQVHAAHGYLLSQFMNPYLNQRLDRYGSDQLLLTSQVMDAVRRGAPNLVTDVRVSLVDGVGPENEELACREQQIDTLARYGCGIVSISSGSYDLSRELIYPSMKSGAGVYLERARDFAVRHPDTVWNVAGNIWSLAAAPSLPTNLTLGIGRSLIADPGFVEKELSGQQSAVSQCKRSGSCHYYTRGRSFISCPSSDDLPSSDNN